MSRLAAPAAAPAASTVPAQRPAGDWLAQHRWWWLGALGALLLLGGLLRLSLLVRAGWLMEGDDALSALMALRILDGDRPLMLKNQAYGASWEPYLMALSFSTFGVSRVAARLPELLTSLGVILATGWLAGEVAGRPAAWFAMLLAAAPPVYVLVLAEKPWAPYTEVILLGLLALGCAVRLGWRRPTRRLAVACGLLGGFAMWMHPLAIWYLGAAAIAVVLRVRPPQLMRTAGWGLLGFIIGGLPVWVFNLQTGGSTVRYITAGSGGQTADRGAVLGAWWNNDLPRGAGLWHPWGPSPPAFGVVMALLLAAALVWAVVGRRGLRLRPLDALLVLVVLIPTIFTLSGFGGPALNPYGFDATGRYAPPIWSGLSIILGAALASVWRQRRWLATLLCCVPLGINLAAWAAIDPVAAFQSPYWDRLPVDNRPLLAALGEQGVEAIWINHWAGQPLMLDAAAQGQPLVAYDWYDVQAGGIDRFPEYRPLVEQAARPAFVLVTDEAQPELERVLRQMAISFVDVRVPPYVVVIPTSRTIHPSEVTAALDYRY